MNSVNINLFKSTEESTLNLPVLVSSVTGMTHRQGHERQRHNNSNNDGDMIDNYSFPCVPVMFCWQVHRMGKQR